MGSSTFQRAFAGGELSPALAARADTLKYVTGLRLCRNFLVARHGGVLNRPGTRYVNTSKTSSTGTFLLRYVSEIEGESVLIEAGPNYLRFYRTGALVRLTAVPAYNGGTNYQIGDLASSAGVNYVSVAANNAGHAPPAGAFWYAMPSDILEIPTPFGSAGFHWAQSGNIITLTSHTVRPYELICFSLTQWRLQPVVTAPAIGPPTALVITPGPAGTMSLQYVVTTAAADTFEESIASAIQQVNTVSEGTPASPHVISWTPPAVGAVAEYYIYKDPYGNGTFGYIGTSTGTTSFRDSGVTPDFSLTPPLPRILFTTAGNFPSRATSYQQRRIFANTINEPDAVWCSRVGYPSNFTVSSPLLDDDAISFKIAGTQRNPVRHMLGLKTLIVMTDGGEWTIGQPKTPITPGFIPADQETYVGVSDDVRPVIIGNAILYVQGRGSIVRDLRFEQEVEGLAGRDLTLYANHLFDGYTIDRMDFQQTPNSIAWACRSDGVLLGLTYLREQDVWGWHQHTTGAGGLFEDVCVVPEPGEDAVYVLVRRTINGAFVRFIERLERREVVVPGSSYSQNIFFVDAGLSLTAAGSTFVTSISGLGHLEGQVVALVADGHVVFNGDPTSALAPSFTITGGAVPYTLPTPAFVVHAGLPYTCQLETLDLDVSGTSIRDKKKRTGLVSLLLDQSVRTFKVGPTAGRLTAIKLKPSELGQEQVAFTGQEEISISTDYNDYGRIVIQHTDPLPLSILGILPNTELGG